MQPAPATEQSKSSRVHFAEQAYRTVKRRILDNELPPGSHLLERELAEELGMSRTPAREAMLRLANEGLVEVRPRHGMRVLPVSADDMAEIYAVLTGLESTAAGLVAANGLTADEVDALEQAVADMDSALEADDLVAWARADERFHLLLVEYSRNRRLVAIVNTLWDQAHRARMITLQLRPRPENSNADHRAVVDAMIRRDAEKAREVHRNHRENSGKMLVDLLRRYGLNQL